MKNTKRSLQLSNTKTVVTVVFGRRKLKLAVDSRSQHRKPQYTGISSSNARQSWLWVGYQVNSYMAELGTCIAMEKWFRRSSSPIYWTSLYSSRAIRDTDPFHAWAWVLTKAWGYHMYMHSACQFGSLGPGSPGPQILDPQVHWIECPM